MQTFLPYPDFDESARALDTQRLNKQAVEVQQIMKVLVTRGRPAWFNHPAVRMWRGYESDLYAYQAAVVAELNARGRQTVCLNNTWRLWCGAGYPGYGRRAPWLGDEEFHRSHRSNLLRKDPVHYAAFTDGDVSAGYVWPVSKQGELDYARGEGWPRR